MAGLDPAIHETVVRKGVDARNESGHDVKWGRVGGAKPPKDQHGAITIAPVTVVCVVKRIKNAKRPVGYLHF